MKCPAPSCATDIPASVDRCVVCGADVGFPNVRAAAVPEESAALDARYKSALDDATARDCLEPLLEFEVAIADTKAVLSRPLASLHQLCQSDAELYSTFSKAVDAQMRLPKEDKWDQGREALESLLFPNFNREIRFAALSLDGRGPSGYGEASAVLKTDTIKTRATVFEENPFVFVERHKILAGKPLPPGFRATWDRRTRLAAAKLGPRISSQTKPEDFPALLLSTADATDADMIEVHIYGTLHRRNIEAVSITKPKRSADRALLRDLERRLAETGASLRVLT